MKIKVQAQHLQPGDIVGSGEKVVGVIVNSVSHPSSKVRVILDNRNVLWSKYAQIGVERADVEMR